FLGLGAAALVASPRAETPLAGPAPGEDTVVVLDVSASISPAAYPLVARTLRRVVRDAGANGRVGLVLFSDVAQETLPPGTPAASLAAFVRFFVPRPPSDTNPRLQGVFGTDYPDYLNNPWYASFSGGTALSTGLAATRQALALARLRGRVILISDLSGDPSNRRRLREELIAYARDPSLDLRIVPVPGSSPDDV